MSSQHSKLQRDKYNFKVKYFNQTIQCNLKLKKTPINCNLSAEKGWTIVIMDRDHN